LNYVKLILIIFFCFLARY